MRKDKEKSAPRAKFRLVENQLYIVLGKKLVEITITI
jgi:hypothetical protein